MDVRAYRVIDGKTIVAIEIDMDGEFIFKAIDQNKFEGIRRGRYPRKSLDEDFTREELTPFNIDPMAI